MQKTTLITSLTAVLLLAACGGGGGSSSGSGNPSTQPSTPSDIAPTLTGKIQGSYYVYTTYRDASGKATGATLDKHRQEIGHNENRDVLVIGDKKMPLLNGSIYAPDYDVVQKTNNGKEETVALISGTHLSYARYGLGYDTNNKNIMYVFHQGQESKVDALPQRGLATYQGYALAVGKQPITGNSQFRVDFGNKTVKGLLTFDDTNAGDQQGGIGMDYTVVINSNIVGSRFAGQDGRFIYNGAFYGPQGEEIAGNFIDAKQSKILGGFGAKKSTKK